MKTVSVSQLKAKLSEELEYVQGGEEVTITDRGRPVARIVPIPRSSDHEANIDRMVRAGLITRPTEPWPEDFWTRPLTPDPEGLVAKARAEERESGC